MDTPIPSGKPDSNLPVLSVIGAPTSVGTHIPGNERAPSVLRQAGLLEVLLRAGWQVHDCGDVAGPIHPSAEVTEGHRQLQGVIQWNQAVHDAVLAELSVGRLPVLLGGDHSLAVGSISAVARHCRLISKPLHVIWLDAHADYNTAASSPTGNVHGMPLSLLCGEGPSELTHLSGVCPALQVSQIQQIGVRSIDPLEQRRVLQHKLHVFGMAQVQAQGMRSVVHQALANIPANAHLHVSFDLDCLDPSAAPGVGTPVNDGPGVQAMVECMEELAASGLLGSLDVVELNPLKDRSSASTQTLLDLMQVLFSGLARCSLRPREQAHRGLPPGPNVGTQLKALRLKQRREKARLASGDRKAEAPQATGLLLSSLTEAGVQAWFESQGWVPFPYQKQVWKAMQQGHSGLLHATTGAGKTQAVWLGALLRVAALPAVRAACTRVMWITPMRALATDSAKALQRSAQALASDCQVAIQTGDTDSSTRAALLRKPPFGLVSTPESLTLMLTRASSLPNLGKLQVLVVDEWHELIGNKRGVQLQLAIARLVTLNPGLQVWGLSATLGNVQQAMDTLLYPVRNTTKASLVQGKLPKKLLIDSLIPPAFERFPWGGHLGLKQVELVAREIDESASTLVFTNTRSQAEIWYQALLEQRPDYAGALALHHGSLDKAVRDWVEQGLKSGSLKAVVCTSSLDLGVDFLPVERVIQIGSPKGVARLLQRAGRSGHAPGRPSRITVVPTHALELIEAAAARCAATQQQIESRVSPAAPLDVLVQHLVTIAMGSGFEPDALYGEVLNTAAYKDLSRSAFNWALAFVEKGGDSLQAYPDYQRVQADEAGVYRVPRRDIARRHAMSVGTIVSDSAMHVAWMTGGRLGTIEESFIARLKTGDCFSFAGRVLELVKVRDMTAYVRKADRKKATVPQWQGGKMPLSSELAHAALHMLDLAGLALAQGRQAPEPELRALESLLGLQRRWSALPGSSNLLVEEMRSKEGHHLFVYPFEGRTVHIGLASLLAWRASKHVPGTFSIAMNDYGFELLSAEPVDWSGWIGSSIRDSELFSTENLLDDVMACLNASELAQRRFREIARIAGLVFQGYPGAGKSTKQLQASSGLFFEVFRKHDQGNLLLDQAQREALEQELEIRRMRDTLISLHGRALQHMQIDRPTPFAFPLLIERLRETVSTEKLSDRVARMVAELEKAAMRGV